MTGTNKSFVDIGASGTQLIDGVISGFAWGGGSVTYAFPTLAGSYSYTEETSNNFGSVSVEQQNAALFAMEQSFGNAANDGFSVEGFTKLALSAGDEASATLRFAQSDAASPTAYAYYPSADASAGDIWFSTSYAGQEGLDYKFPVAGNYAWHTLMHELGHALGLKHGHETDTFGALPDAKNSIEYSIMTYTGFIGDKTDGYYYEEFGAPQTFMMSDIAALQKMYGADFTTNAGNTVYKWTPTSGDTLVNGEVAIDPGANRIFATIWDGGGTDTYDLSSYTTALKVDLRPGNSSVFSSDQLANLGGGPDSDFAHGNIFNALLFEGNTRSLIENVRGGSGNDTIIGNDAKNMFKGNDGADSMTGGLGADALYGGAGADKFIFVKTTDSTSAIKGRDTIFDFTSSDRIDLSKIDASTKSVGNQAFDFIGTDEFSGTAGELRIKKLASDTYVYADTNGDGKADFSIHFDDALGLQKGFFVV